MAWRLGLDIGTNSIGWAALQLDGEGTFWDVVTQTCIITNPTDTNLDGCTDLNDLMDILAAYGDCALPAFTCGDDVEHDGYEYSTVQIGEQCWFSENCF